MLFLKQHIITVVCTILNQSRNYLAPVNIIPLRTQKSFPPTRRPITARPMSTSEANHSTTNVNIRSQSQHDTCQC
ncbi:hypothetical protein C1H46_035296 [Malus baccata]|uniref:Uncharacterized protein n=1 Tax=Malus baccata TaxID=106549 RepID=A0A540KY33_MALBA|nr:hypothetical protein C1H46_035296 [Malus baccata]